MSNFWQLKTQNGEQICLFSSMCIVYYVYYTCNSYFRQNIYTMENIIEAIISEAISVGYYDY